MVLVVLDRRRFDCRRRGAGGRRDAPGMVEITRVTTSARADQVDPYEVSVLVNANVDCCGPGARERTGRLCRGGLRSWSGGLEPGRANSAVARGRGLHRGHGDRSGHAERIPSHRCGSSVVLLLASVLPTELPRSCHETDEVRSGTTR